MKFTLKDFLLISFIACFTGGLITQFPSWLISIETKGDQYIVHSINAIYSVSCSGMQSKLLYPAIEHPEYEVWPGTPIDPPDLNHDWFMGNKIIWTKPYLPFQFSVYTNFFKYEFKINEQGVMTVVRAKWRT